MQIILTGMLLLAVLTSIPSTMEYEAEAKAFPEKTIWREEELLLLAEKYANIHGASSAKVKQIMICEAPWKYDKQGRYYDKNDPQSRLTYNTGQIARNPTWGEVGDRERSFGPGMIHEPAHPTITREQAIDPDFTLDFMAENVAKGRSGMWTCSGS